ncbi:hypothetical protein AK88_05590 [Plasmodium fragile]|uniref:Schizont-infected cell agglutination extracellular alpha domain-containing protein n=1 Tax=Plasmodium fragile TaxID=5857 RepID=A0A0D9QCS5_PLAFR|nr:uncharacterized protein AK88_05590 [Plasmodium fragile]KJP84779.1 hypothetical protein AK88_05590 [Plasmodium fragile]
MEADTTYWNQNFWNVIKQSRLLDTQCELGKKIHGRIKNVIAKVNPPATAPKVNKARPNTEGGAKSATPQPKDSGASKAQGGQTATTPAPDPTRPTVAPAPAKSAPAKSVKPAPVAEKAVVTGPGTKPGTTTASAGGGGGGGSGAAGAGTAKGKTVKAGTGHDCDADRARPRRSNAVYVVTPRDDNEWNKWKTVLENFKKYMDEHTDLAAEYGANCDNSGWDDVKDQRHYYKGQTVADVVRCRVMSVAWAFANRWDMPGTKTNTDDTQQMDPEEENMLRCEVANTFGHLLQTKYCPGQNQWIRGVEYSRIAFTKMNSSGQDGVGEIKGPVIDGTCTACGYKGHERLSKAINWNVVEWLMQEGQITAEITAMEQAWPCEQSWHQYINELDPAHNPITHGPRDWNSIHDRLSDAGKKKLETAEKDMEGEVKKIIETVQQARDGILQKARQAFQEVHKNAHKDATETTPKATDKTAQGTSNEKNDEKSKEEKVENTGENKDDQQDKGDKSLPAAAPGAAVTRSDPDPEDVVQPQAPASPVLPARPPPPPPASICPQGEPGSRAASSGTGSTSSGTGVGTGAPSADTEQTVVNAGAGVQGASSITTITFGTSSRTHDDCDKKSKDSGPGTEGVDRTTSRSPGAPAGGNTGDQKDPLKPEETAKEKSTIAAARDTSQHTPKDPQKPHDHVDNPPTTNTLDGSSKDQSDKSNTRPKEQPTIKDPVFDAEFWDFVTGVSPKNDKTKNKDEFGPLDANIPGLTGTACSGNEKLCSLNTAYRGTGASGPASPPSTTNHEGTGSNKTNGGNDFGLGTDPPKPEGELGGNYGPRPAQVPHPIGPNKGPSNDGGPTPPDLTDTVLTATTPILFFVTFVTVALLGYSLWKVSTATRHSHNNAQHTSTHKYNRVQNGRTTVSGHIPHPASPWPHVPTTNKRET